MHPRPTNGQTDYPTAVGHLIDALDRRLKGNLLDNGAFQIWQHGTSIAAAASAVIGPDRWVFLRGGFATGATVSQQVGGNAQYCARVQRDNSNASVANVTFAQALESAASIPYRSKNLALAFRARAGANFSAASAILLAQLVSGTGTDQNISSGFTGQAIVASLNATLTASFQDFILPIAAPGAAINQLGVIFSFTPVGTAGAADYVEIEQVQLVRGDYVGEFPYRSPAEELMICQRFLPAAAATGTNQYVGVGSASSTTQGYALVPFAQQARVAPTGISISSAAHFSVNDNVSGLVALTSLVFSTAGPRQGLVQFNVAAGVTQFRPYILGFNNASGLLLFTGAELF